VSLHKLELFDPINLFRLDVVTLHSEAVSNNATMSCRYDDDRYGFKYFLLCSIQIVRNILTLQLVPIVLKDSLEIFYFSMVNVIRVYSVIRGMIHSLWMLFL